MKIKKLSLDNFRCFNRLELLLRGRVNLLIGNNGSGKSALLEGLSVGLGTVLTHLPDVSGVSFRKYDIREEEGRKTPYVRVGLETQDGICWDVTQSRDKSLATKKLIPRAAGSRQLVSALNTGILDRYNNALDFSLPVFACYGVGRAVLDIPLSRKGFQKKASRFEALSGALNADSRFRSAFIWFYNMENQEHRLQKERKSFDATLKELDVVRGAMSIMFPDLSDPHIEVNPLRFMVKKNGQSLALDQLSDGYKTTLGLVIDLCARYAMANPHLSDPLAGDALVMIDEVDLHLHPSWQQRILGDLLRTFPHTQFILTTHSPYVVGALNNHLKRHKVRHLALNDPRLTNIAPLSPDDVTAYLLENAATTDIMDRDLGLVDDKLITHFNEINMLYDRMRDLEWEEMHA